MLKDYDVEILYHLGKANVVANTFSRKITYGMAALLTGEKSLLEDLRKLRVEMITERVEAHFASLSLQPTLLELIKREQKSSDEGIRIVEAIKSGQRKELRLDEEESIRFVNRLWVPKMAGLRKEILPHTPFTPEYQDV